MRSINEDEAFDQDRILRSLRSFPIDLLKIYPRSFRLKNGLWYGLIRTAEALKLAVMGGRSHVLKDAFQGDCYHQSSSLKLCDLTKENRGCLMDLFPYTKPISLRSYPMTIGVGDPLGLANPGYIRAVRKFQAHPVLARPSLKENERTATNLTQVIGDVAWVVFQENYQEGYGADGGHLNSLQEVKRVLDAGASMITLDLSEKIDPEVLRQPKELVNQRFVEEIDEGDAKVILHLFLDKEFVFRGTEGEFSVQFDDESVKRNALLFYKSLDFTEEVYEWVRLRGKNRGAIDFEISLDKTPFPTSPENHFFLALELSHRGVHIQSLAPRFAGEFQRGVNMRGDREAFRVQFYRHVLIGEDYGYKISIHFKNNQFSLLPEIGRLSKGFLDFKAADASWPEAMRLVALVHPALYREMHSLALSQFIEASKPYAVKVDLKRIPKLEELSDEHLPALLDEEDCRQLFHVAYESLLNATNPSGEYLFRKKLYHILTRYEEDYWSLLETHIEKHLTALGVSPSPLLRQTQDDEPSRIIC
ncbi:MAG: tagaturonate epimerase family protein [Thermodesulfobacteriota bacterium]